MIDLTATELTRRYEELCKELRESEARFLEPIVNAIYELAKKHEKETSSQPG